jgi:tetratricopeptide (TPR) repeat protein
MNSDFPAKPPKRKSKLAWILTGIVLIATAGVWVLGREHQRLNANCTYKVLDPQAKLAACDTFLKWAAYAPSTRSLFHRHKMRVHMQQQDWHQAHREADLAAKADPDSPVPWQWKAKIFYETGESQSSLQALNTSLALDPENTYSLENKYKLLLELEDYAAIDDMVFSVWNRGDSAVWLPEDHLQKITWNPSRFPKSQTAFLKNTLEARDELAGNPRDRELQFMFLLHCRLLAGNCPPLLPDKRASYLQPVCDEVIEDFEQTHPKVIKRVLDASGYPTWRDLIAKDRQAATVEVQAIYLWFVLDFEPAPSAELSRIMIVNHRMFECISDGEFVFPDHVEGGAVNAMRDAETLFNKALRMNLLDLAYVYVN